MATIRKRGNSYQIRVSCGYDTSGNQVVQTMTWKPADGMNKKQIEKELQKQAILFEDKCMKGQVTANIKFQDFAEQWFEEYAKLNLRNTSYERMKQLTVRVYPAIGHLRLDKITSRHIQQFINDLALNGKSLKNGRPLSRKTAVHHLSFISDVFSYAVKMEMLTDNPCKRVTPYFWLGEFCEKHDLPFYGLHSFRHLFASLLVNQGVDIVTVSGALGHSTVSTTSNIYCHMLEESRAKVSDAVSSALDFSGKKKEPKGA